MKFMKQLLLFAGFTVCLLQLSAQRTSLGFHGTATEYIGDLNNHNYSLYKFKYFKPGGGVSLQIKLNPSFNLYGYGGYNRVQYSEPNGRMLTRAVAPGVPFIPYSVDADFFNLDLMLKYKFNNGYILSENAAIAPFLIGGVGGTNIRTKIYPQRNFGGTAFKFPNGGETKASLMAGAGLFFRFNDIVGIEASSIFNRPLWDDWDGSKSGTGMAYDIYLQHSIGLIFSLTKPKDTDKDGVADRKDSCPNTPPGVAVDAKGCPIDTDGDGVPDYIDKCPQQPGSPALNGCPDTDKDGIADIDDKCPTVAGLAKFGGCPDSDNDGVEDSKDKCPNTPAGTPVDANGCPLDSDGDGVPDNLDRCPNTPAGTQVDWKGCTLDTDKDGVPDSVDRCPTTPGPASNRGCPEVKEEVKKRLKFATKGIFFDFGKATLKSTSYPTLDEVVDILNQYPDYNLRMGGHTDAVGSDAANLKLSQARVDAVKNYFVGKGIPDSRIEATGYGESRPIATNKTAVGRAQNRRVEMELYLK